MSDEDLASAFIILKYTVRILQTKRLRVRYYKDILQLIGILKTCNLRSYKIGMLYVYICTFILIFHIRA